MPRFLLTNQAKFLFYRTMLTYGRFKLIHLFIFISVLLLSQAIFIYLFLQNHALMKLKNV